MSFHSPLDYCEQLPFIFRIDTEEITVDDSKVQRFHSCSGGADVPGRDFQRSSAVITLCIPCRRNIHIPTREHLDDSRDTHPRSSQLQQVRAEHDLAANTICLEEHHLPTLSSLFAIISIVGGTVTIQFPRWGN